MKKVERDNTKKVECLKREMKINFSSSLGREGKGQEEKKETMEKMMRRR